MKVDGRIRLAIILIVFGALIQGGYGIQVTFFSGDVGESGSVAMHIDAADDAAVHSEVTIDGAGISPITKIIGPILLFEQNHDFRDGTGKSAKAYVKVVNEANGLYYSSTIPSGEGYMKAQPWVSDEQQLAVPEAAIRQSPSYGEAWNNTGKALDLLGLHKEAANAYARAWYENGFALLGQGKYDESLKFLDKAIKLDPELAAAWYNKGVSLSKLGRTAEADAAFAKARELGYTG